MRFFKELFNPALKCERLGHKPVVEWRKGYTNPTSSDWDRYRVVVHRSTQEQVCCARCKKADPWETVKKEGIHGLTAPQSTWDAINAGGSWSEWGRRRFDGAGASVLTLPTASPKTLVDDN